VSLIEIVKEKYLQEVPEQFEAIIFSNRTSYVFFGLLCSEIKTGSAKNKNIG
jgi:hypothetical protein